jgi:VCBS repeat-containing protein
VTGFIHEATVELADGADPRALGGAITVALCGNWDHEPPCRWPHQTDVAATPAGHTVTTTFTVTAEDEPVVRQKIVAALRSGQQAGPDGRVGGWTMHVEAPES